MTMWRTMPRAPLAEIADIIKVDLLLSSEEQRADLVQQYGPCRCRMLAEKIETQTDFLRAGDQGFVPFQGFFFRRPEMSNTHDMPAGRLHSRRMLQEVSRPELDVGEREKLIKSETSVCYRLLRYLNWAVFGLKSDSLGASRTGYAGRAPGAALGSPVGGGRGKTREGQRPGAVSAGAGAFRRIAAARGTARRIGLFLLGLVSLMDAMLEMPMDEVLGKIPIDHETKAVLLGQPSLLRPVYQLVLAHEGGEWEAACQLSENLHLDSNEVAGYYGLAQQWAHEVASGA